MPASLSTQRQKMSITARGSATTADSSRARWPVEAGMVFHYDGTGMGTQQVVKLSVDIQKLFNIGPKAKK